MRKVDGVRIIFLITAFILNKKKFSPYITGNALDPHKEDQAVNVV
jgi:hypothetical protein